MKFYKILDEELFIGSKFKLNNLTCVLSQEFLDNNPDIITEKDINYVKLINRGRDIWGAFWSVGGEFTGEVFDLSNLNNLSKFKNSISKDDFKKTLLRNIELGYFEICKKDDYEYQELLREAKRKYPIGTRVDQRKAYNGSGGIYTILNHNDDRSNLHDGIINITLGGTGLYNSKYKIWAEVLKPVCKDYIGLEVYPGESVYLVHNKTFTIDKLDCVYFKVDPKYTVFCNYRDAEEWVKENKPKTLADYCHELFITDPVFYTMLRNKEPKLYWTKVFQLIADKKPKYDTFGFKWFVSYNKWGDITIMKHETVNYGLVYFASCRDAQIAAELMGDKLVFVTPKI